MSLFERLFGRPQEKLRYELSDLGKDLMDLAKGRHDILVESNLPYAPGMADRSLDFAVFHDWTLYLIREENWGPGAYRLRNEPCRVVRINPDKSWGEVEGGGIELVSHVPAWREHLSIDPSSLVPCVVMSCPDATVDMGGGVGAHNFRLFSSDDLFERLDKQWRLASKPNEDMVRRVRASRAPGTAYSPRR